MPAIVDIKTGKISGCKNDFERNHEKAHLIFQKSKFGNNIQYLFETAHTYLLGSLAISFFIYIFKYISVALFIFILACIVFEELWCNEYAMKKCRKVFKAKLT